MFNTDLRLTFNISACSNKCLHCWAEGSPKRQFMDLATIKSLIPQIIETKELFNGFFPFFFYEPSLHPDFLAILELFKENNLLPADYYIPTNGYKFGSFSDADWQRFKRIDPIALQFCVYGLETEHDEFAGRQGAFNDLVKAMQATDKQGVEWFTAIIVSRKNITQIAQIRDYFKKMFPHKSLGKFLYLYTGLADRLGMITKPEFEQLPEAETAGMLKFYKTEKEQVAKVIDSPKLQMQPAECSCRGVRLIIDTDLSVYCGSACDSGGVRSALPESYQKEFLLGNLKEDSLAEIAKNYLANPPRIIQELEKVTYHDLALKYGGDSEELYLLNNLFEVKYAALYLRENYRLR